MESIAAVQRQLRIDAPGRVPQVDYVLGRFTPEQQPVMDGALNDAVAATEVWATKGAAEAANRFNRKAPSDA